MPEQDGVMAAAVRSEQQVVDALYGRLDVLRARVAGDLERVRRTTAGGTHQARSERDAYATMYEDRLAQLRGVEERLCFGRLDLRGGDQRYIGRLGLVDDDQRRLLVDWRAEAATPFYQATAAHPLDVVRRRHLQTRGRSVVSVEDEVLDLDHLDSAAQLAGEGALLAAVNAQRTGRMGDIVATIQAEQDAIIRSDLDGVLVVEGGPGTGKTAVALHRAAYLLYGHRKRLARSGVLVIGPTPVFMRYIEQVLPSLGETGVVMMTPGQLFPGVVAEQGDLPPVARLKGDLRMAQAVATAVRDRQRDLTRPVELRIDGRTLRLTPGMVRAAQDKARRTGRPHNQARVTFAKDLLSQLAGRLADQLGGVDEHDRQGLIADLRDNIDVRREINLLWMPLTAQRVISRLLSDPDRLRHAAPWLTDAGLETLLRPVDAAFTIDDVPLLDEAAELLGEDEAAADAAAAQADAERRELTAYARQVLAMTGSNGLVSADQVVAGLSGGGSDLTLAERAAGDRTWTYGHVVVDEAQELSAMMWRLLGRRNPTRSMTVVGDLAQTHAAAGAHRWADVLAPLVQDRWRARTLTVSYRTPAQIMTVAADLLARSGSDAPVPQSVREGTWPPTVATAASEGQIADLVARAVTRMSGEVPGGKIGVVAVPDRLPDLVETLRAALGAEQIGTGYTALDRQVAVLGITEVKGLEFDSVVLVDPASILDSGPRGINDLYVAVTRPTQQLHVVHHRPLPPGLETLTPER